VIGAPELTAALLACLEGTRLKAYRDSGGILTIGTGHTGPDVTEDMVITFDQAVELLAKDQGQVLAMLQGKPPLEAAALASFGYNCGRGALAKILAGTDSIDNPRHQHDAKGNLLPGLVSRRHLEQTLIRFAKGE